MKVRMTGELNIKKVEIAFEMYGSPVADPIVTVTGEVSPWNYRTAGAPQIIVSFPLRPGDGDYLKSIFEEEAFEVMEGESCKK